MKNKVAVIKESVEYSGYLTLSKFDFKISSLHPQKESILLKDIEVVRAHNSVHILLYSPQIDSFVLGEEFRQGAYVNGAENPYILQTIAGTIEKNEKPEQAALREIKEEAGIEVKNLQPIAQIYKSPGITSEKSFLFYGELDTIPKPGLHGLGDEEIKTHLVEKNRAYQMMDESRIEDSSTLLSLYWYRLTKR